jgi:predicted nucleic acid-binding protein
VIYIDTSALIRALLDGTSDHAAAAAVLADPPRALISSELLWLEADRTAIRLANDDPAFGALPSDVAGALATIDQIALDHSIITAARAIPQVIKSLDAIHVASAESLSDALECVLTYDKTLTVVLAARGMPVATASDILPFGRRSKLWGHSNLDNRS